VVLRLGTSSSNGELVKLNYEEREWFMPKSGAADRRLFTELEAEKWSELTFEAYRRDGIP